MAAAMAKVQVFDPGGYRFMEHAFQYSGGVAAEPSFAIERVRLAKPLPLAQGFDAVEAYLASRGRPHQAFCACELRSPAQLTDAGFVAFNRHYVQRLAAWGIFRDEINPVARTNVCPVIDPPAEPCLYAFSYTTPALPGEHGGFVASGSGEASGASGSYAERIVRPGDASPEGIAEKARFVLGEMERRMEALGVGWNAVTATQLYTVYDIHPCLAEAFVRRGATAAGLIWHYARPPVQGLDLEVDVRGLARELVV